MDIGEQMDSFGTWLHRKWYAASIKTKSNALFEEKWNRCTVKLYTFSCVYILTLQSCRNVGQIFELDTESVKGEFKVSREVRGMSREKKLSGAWVSTASWKVTPPKTLLLDLRMPDTADATTCSRQFTLEPERPTGASGKGKWEQ